MNSRKSGVRGPDPGMQTLCKALEEGFLRHARNVCRCWAGDVRGLHIGGCGRRTAFGTRLAAMGRESARVLPLITDYGPHFQQRPSMETDAVTLKELERFKWTFDERMRATEGPKKVIMNVTYKCNNRCTFCATGTRTQFDGDYDRQREMLVKYRKLGVGLLDFDGGEPTLNPNLFALTKFARKIGYETVNVG